MNRLTLAGCLLCCLAGCDTLPIPSQASHNDEAAYTALDPYYVEFCALSEIQKKPGYGADIRGGVGGHSTIYLNGVCRTGDSYPEIAVCPTDPASNGVGLSVNAHFANANWVAIPGRDFFYHGDLKPNQALTRPVYDATKAHAARLGIYDAIRFHDVVFEDMPPGYTRDAFKYEVSIGTDYAVGYARDRYCARVPVSAAQMARITDYLNGLNRPYREGKAVYEWSVLNDNCIHVAHNALSSIGFWPLWPTHRLILVAAFDFPVPKNEFVNIMRRANDMPVEDLLAVWDDRPARRALLAGEGIPTRPGAIATFESVAHDNPLYNTDLQLIFYDDPIFGPYEGWYRQIAADARYTDLDTNLLRFRVLYAQIESDQRPLGWWLTAHPELRREPEFPAFYSRYYAEVERASAAISTAHAVASATAAHPVVTAAGH
jgi:hypothetical protein